MTNDSAKPIKQADSDRPKPIDILADYRYWRSKQEDRIGTHSPECHVWPRHERCMIHRLARELERTRAALVAIAHQDGTLAVSDGRLFVDVDGVEELAFDYTPPTQPTPGECSTPREGTSEPVALGTAHGIADTATACGPGDAKRLGAANSGDDRRSVGGEHAGSAAATRGRTMTNDNEEPSAASAGSVALRQPFAWAVCNPVGTYYRSFGYHHEALECCLRKTRETGDCFYLRAMYAAPPQDEVVRLPPLDPNGAPGWNAAIGAVREALANAGVDWDTE